MEGLTRDQKQWLIVVIAGVTAALLSVLYILLGQHSPGEGFVNLIRQSIPSAFTVVVSFLIIYFLFKQQGISFEEHATPEGKLSSVLDDIKENLIVDQKLRNNGIVTIYHDRQEYLCELRDELSALLAKESPEEEDLQIIGISLRDFMNALHPANRKLRDNLILGITRDVLKVKALVMKEGSEQAKIRKKMDEQGLPPGTSSLDGDIENALIFFRKYRATNQCLQMKQYSDVPCSCFMVKFKDYIVVEQYHGGGLGGEIPVVKYRDNSDPGDRFKRHFDFLWDHKSTQSVV